MRRTICLLSILFTAAALVSCAADNPGPTAPGIRAPVADVVDAAAPVDFYGLASSDLAAAGAVVLDGFLCGLGPAGLTTDSHAVITPSGNVNLVCHGQTPVGPPETLVFNDFPCGTQGGLTFDSHLVWTKSGNASLTCHFKP